MSHVSVSLSFPGSTGESRIQKKPGCPIKNLGHDGKRGSSLRHSRAGGNPEFSQKELDSGWSLSPQLISGEPVGMTATKRDLGNKDFSEKVII